MSFCSIHLNNIPAGSLAPLSVACEVPNANSLIGSPADESISEQMQTPDNPTVSQQCEAG